MKKSSTLGSISGSRKQAAKKATAPPMAERNQEVTAGQEMFYPHMSQLDITSKIDWQSEKSRPGAPATPQKQADLPQLFQRNDDLDNVQRQLSRINGTVKSGSLNRRRNVEPLGFGTQEPTNRKFGEPPEGQDADLSEIARRQV